MVKEDEDNGNDVKVEAYCSDVALSVWGFSVICKSFGNDCGKHQIQAQNNSLLAVILLILTHLTPSFIEFITRFI